jgi:hypothetical protein
MDPRHARVVEVLEVEGQLREGVAYRSHGKFSLAQLFVRKVVVLVVHVPKQAVGAQVPLGLDAEKLQEGVGVLGARLLRRGRRGQVVMAQDKRVG